MANVRVSVVMPTYNYGRFIGEAIDGFLNQTFADFELIVVDDGSTDHTQDVIAGYDDKRIRVIERKENSGSAVWTRNDGMAVARGEYIAVADADDVSVPKRLANQVRFLDCHDDVDFVGGGLVPVDPKGRRLAGPTYKPVFRKKPEKYRLAMLREQSVVCHGTMMFRKQVLDKMGGYHFYASSGDYEFLLRASRYFTFCNLHRVLIHCRQHSTSTTYTFGKRMKPHFHTVILAQEYLWLSRQGGFKE